MDRRDTGAVDIVWNIESLEDRCLCTPAEPWPFASDSCDKLLLCHLVEHLKPWLMVDIMNEAWRIMNPAGQLLIATPYAGSAGFWQDPTHTKGWSEVTAFYFDPQHISLLWNVYRPKPWSIRRCNWSPYHNMEIVMEPVKCPIQCRICGAGPFEQDVFEKHWSGCYARFKGKEDRANADK